MIGSAKNEESGLEDGVPEDAMYLSPAVWWWLQNLTNAFFPSASQITWK